jgi:hypothetical protein
MDTARRRVRITLAGAVHGQDIAESIQAIDRDPQWQAGFDTLWSGR